MNKKIEIQEGIAVEEMKFTLRNDYAFKKVFGNQNNKEPLIELLSLILGISKESIEDVMIENPFLENEFYDEKKAILDLKLTLKDGKKINIEMQNYWQTYFVPRVLYYWSKRYIEDFKESNEYYKLNPCISINILNEKFKYSNTIHSVYELLERSAHTNLENYLEIHFLDLTRLEKCDLSLLEKWLLFIKTDEQEVRNMLSMETVAMSDANKIIQTFYTNPNDRYQYEAAERLEAEKKSLLGVGILQGRAEGISLGRAEGISLGRAEGISQGIVQRNFEIARNMKLSGLLDADIMKYTGLSQKDLESL